jgi:hypothetical protein
MVLSSDSMNKKWRYFKIVPVCHQASHKEDVWVSGGRAACIPNLGSVNMSSQLFVPVTFTSGQNNPSDPLCRRDGWGPEPVWNCGQK